MSQALSQEKPGKLLTVPIASTFRILPVSIASFYNRKIQFRAAIVLEICAQKLLMRAQSIARFPKLEFPYGPVQSSGLVKMNGGRNWIQTNEGGGAETLFSNVHPIPRRVQTALQPSLAAWQENATRKSSRNAKLDTQTKAQKNPAS